MIADIDLWKVSTTINAVASVTSVSIGQHRSVGYCSLLLLITGGAPSLDVSMTVGKTVEGTFYTPYDLDSNNIGVIRSGIIASQWIQFAPVVAPYFKITITGTVTNGADTAIQAWAFFQEE